MDNKRISKSQATHGILIHVADPLSNEENFEVSLQHGRTSKSEVVVTPVADSRLQSEQGQHPTLVRRPKTVPESAKQVACYANA
jgi:hypothetical protein